MAACFLTCASSNSPCTEKCNGKSLEYYYYHLMLMLNPAKSDAYWEKEIIDRLTDIMDNPHEPHEQTRKQKIQNLTLLLQADLDLEWHGMMEEGKKGVLKDKKKEKLRYEYYMNSLVST